MTRSYNYDCFRTGIRITLRVEVTERTTFLELCDLLVEALRPFEPERSLTIRVLSRGSLGVFDSEEKFKQVGLFLFREGNTIWSPS